MNRKESGKSSLTTMMKRSLQISTTELSDLDIDKISDGDQDSVQYNASNDGQKQTRVRLDSTTSEVTDDENCKTKEQQG